MTLIAGATASGKSRLALETAERTDAVILNADSQQLYADLRILTARPSPDDEARADHRLYGVADAAEAWSVGRWLRAAVPLIEELTAQGRPVLIVGGTGLYFSALTKGLAEIPPVPAPVQEATEAVWAQGGEALVRDRLAAVDPVSAAVIEAGDRQRLMRALSVHAATGRALSEWRTDTRAVLTPGAYHAVVVEPDRVALYAACDARVAAMVEAGALEEVRVLVARGLDPALPAMKAVGVREFAAHLAGNLPLDAAVDAVRQATRNYAKRQLTWFRNQTPGWTRVS